MAATGGGYQGLARVGDPSTAAVLKNILDRLGALEQRVAALTTQVTALPPAGMTDAQIQQYVQQQVAQLKAQILQMISELPP